MPYIKQEHRRTWNDLTIDETEEDYSLDIGELNYIMTKWCLVYLSQRDKKYEAYNAVIGALECCKLEVYRRAVAPYEDKKIKENGDVY